VLRQSCLNATHSPSGRTPLAAPLGSHGNHGSCGPCAFFSFGAGLECLGRIGASHARVPFLSLPFSQRERNERLLNFPVGDFDSIYEALLELYGKHGTFFIDEIQAVPEFDRFIRRFYESGFKFFISGSNASLLRLDISTRLTGRHVDVTLKPFSFPEFLKLLDVTIHDPVKLGTEVRVTIP
jgi:hypothetical protein